VPLDSETRHRLLSEGARRGLRSRWGPRRVVRLDTLEPPVAAAIRALIDADQETKKAAAEGQSPATAEPEVQSSARPAA
jgi:hypothetical protein